MKFRVKVSDGTTDWWETFDLATDDPNLWAQETIAYFNTTLKPGEKSRMVAEVEVLDKDSVERHEWEKASLVTEMNRHGDHDRMKCKNCSITAKRYGIGGGITVDSQYKSKIYQRCDTAQAHMIKRGLHR